MHTKSLKQFLQLSVALITLLFVGVGDLMAQVIDVENVIDVTDTYITNASFETGDMTGWTIYGRDNEGGEDHNDIFGVKNVADIPLSGNDGGKIFEAYMDWWTGWNSFYQVTQALSPDLPVGTYTLTAVLWTDNYDGAKNPTLTDKPVSLFAGPNTTVGLSNINQLYSNRFDVIGLNPADGYKGNFAAVTFHWDGTDRTHPIIIGAGLVSAPSYRMTWFKADNFRLYKHKTDAPSLLSNPSFEANNAVVNALSSPSISAWTPWGTSRSGRYTSDLLGGTTKFQTRDNIYFGVINASSNGGTNGSRLKNNGYATPLHPSSDGYCALIRIGNNEGKKGYDSSSAINAFSNAEGKLTSTASGLTPGMYVCKMYYKLVHVGDGTPSVTLTVTPQSGRGDAASQSESWSINTGLTSQNNTNYTLNGSWDDFSWRELSTKFIITGTGNATAGIELKLTAQNTKGALAQPVTIGADYYAFDTEAIFDNVVITQLSSSSSSLAGETVYFQNEETGQWLSAGASSGTHATTDDTGLPVTLQTGSLLGKFHLQTPFTETYDGITGSGYINDHLHCDGVANDFQLQLSPSAKAAGNDNVYYILSPAGRLLSSNGISTDYQEKEINSCNINTTASALPPASTRWKMMTRQDRIDALPGPQPAGTHVDAVNVTFLIDDANFDRCRNHGTSWTGETGLSHLGRNENLLKEKVGGTFNLSQTFLSDFPAGHYALRVQGYYRPGSNSNVSDAHNAILYASNTKDGMVTAPMLLVTDDGKPSKVGPFDTENTQTGSTLFVPNHFTTASDALSSGYYDRVLDYNVVTFTKEASGGIPTIGVKKENTITDDWFVVDNFRLYFSPQSEEEALEEALKDVELPTEQMYDQVCLNMYESNTSYTTIKNHYQDSEYSPRPAIRDVLEAYEDVMSKVSDARLSIEDYKVIFKYREGLRQGAKPLGDVPQATYLASSAYTKYADGTAANAYVAPGSTGTFTGSADFFSTYKSFLNNWFEENGLEEGSDLTGFIYNQGFEFGDTEAWTHNNSSDTGARETSNGTYAATGSEGDYLFNTWWQGVPLTQTVTDLPQGKYTLQVKLTGADDGADGKHFLTINDQHSDVFTSDRGTKGTFYTRTYDFEVSDDGIATIGVVGGNDAGEFVAGGHWWYKVDDFRLILREPAMPESDRYYLFNKGNGQYLSTHGGAGYGTQAMTDDVGLDFGFDKANATFDSKVYSNGAAANSQTGGHFLYKTNDGVWLDGDAAASTWKFGKKKVGDVQYYYLKSADGNYLTAGAKNAVVGMGTTKSDATLWQLKTRAQRVQELEDMESGDAAVDATFLLPGNDLTRGDRRVFDSWNAVNNAGNAGFGVYSADTNNFEDEHFPDDHTDKYYEVNGSPRFRRGGRNDNYVFDAWHNPFDMYQELTGLPNGVYTLSAQCFDGEGGGSTQFYSESPIHLDLTPMSVPFVRDIMIDWKQDFPKNTGSGLAGNGFTSGRISAAMTDATIARSSGMKIKVVNGSIKIGFRNTYWDQWTVADNLRLTYRPFVEADVQEEIDPAQAWLDNMVNVDRTDPYDDGAFKIPNDEIHRLALQAAVNHADDRKAGTEADMTEGLYYLLPAAKEVMENTDPADFAINDPGTSNKFQIVGQDFADKVLTVRAANGAVDSGNENPVKLGFTGEGDADRIFPQAFTFEKVDGLINGYRLRYDIGTETRYLCTGTAVGSTVDWKDSQIRSTTDASKALSFRIIALTTADDTWYLRNNVTNTKVGHTNTDFYTGDTNYNMGFVPAIEASASVSVSDVYKFSTLMLPFDAELPEGVTAYTVKGTLSDKTIALQTVGRNVQANVPYVIYAENGLSATTLRGFGKAYTDDTQNDEQLTGTFFGQEDGRDIYVPKDCYVLSVKNYCGENRVAFYRVTEENTVRLPKYRAYYTHKDFAAVAPSPAPARASAYGFTILDDNKTPADIITLVNIILRKDNKESAPRFVQRADGKVVYTDINGDGEVTLADVTALVNMMHGK